MLPLQEWVPGVIIALEITWSFYCSEMFMVCETGSSNSNNFTNLTVLHDIGASCNNLLLHYILQYVPSNSLIFRKRITYYFLRKLSL